MAGPHIRISDDEAFADTSIMGVSSYQVDSPELIPDQSNWREMSMDERKASNEAYDAIGTPDRNIDRDDPALIATVEALGEAASGRCASLKIIEIPDGVDWQVEEYDGREHIAERHRTWP